MNAFDQPGKAQIEFLKNIIYPQCGSFRNEVLTQPGYGVDVSVIELPGNLAIAITSDPLSLIPSLGLYESAWLSVHLMANDMATTGFSPMYAQFVLNLPPDLSSHAFKEYWGHIHSICKEIGVAITGGHTGQVEGQNSTIAGGGTMLLVAPKSEIILSKNAKPGDSIIVTKECALSSSSILSMSFPKTVINKLGTEVYQKGCNLFFETSSLKTGLIAGNCKKENNANCVSAMHDVTEGGVLGAIYEMAKASDCGVMVNSDMLPVREVQKSICNLFGIDYRYCIGAGAVVITTAKETEDQVLKSLSEGGVKASVVGKVTTLDKGLVLIENGVEKELMHPGNDPYWEAFYNAFKKGWK